MRLLFQSRKKSTLNPRIKLESLKENLPHIIEIHNRVVKLLWSIDLKLTKYRKRLQEMVNDDPLKNVLEEKIASLEQSRKTINNCLEKNQSFRLIQERKSEIKQLEFELHGEKITRSR